MIFAALTLIAVLTVLLVASVAVIAHDLADEQRARQSTEQRVPVSV